MKKTIWICLFFIIYFGCQETKVAPSTPFREWLKPNGKLKVLSTTEIIGDFVKRIGGEHIDHLNLIEGDIDPHSYELVKGDDEKLECAQIVFCNGLGLEHGASLQRRLQLHSKTVAVGTEIEKRYPEMILKQHHQVDPHIWMDPSIWVKSIDFIVSALSDLDPNRSVYFSSKGYELKVLIETLDKDLQALFDQIQPQKRYLVTSHDAFNYFTRRYLATEEEKSSANWRQRCIAPEGLAPEGQLSIADMQNVLDKIELYNIGVLFFESNINPDCLKKMVSICREKKLKVRLSEFPLYSDTIGHDSGMAHNYEQMIRYNAHLMVKEWQND
ncbi:MAG: metal ABC transporter solute-binding protein, Zn/Mn family [Rhabdochlamydiaceae bacterium]